MPAPVLAKRTRWSYQGPREVGTPSRRRRLSGALGSWGPTSSAPTPDRSPDPPRGWLAPSLP